MIINELKINRYHCGYYSAMVSIFRFYFGLLNRVPVEGETVYVGFNEGIAALHLDEFERSHSADRVLLSAVDLGRDSDVAQVSSVIWSRGTRV